VPKWLSISFLNIQPTCLLTSLAIHVSVAKENSKKACEQYWSGKISKEELQSPGISVEIRTLENPAGKWH
jgi:hypothetical protein